GAVQRPASVRPHDGRGRRRRGARRGLVSGPTHRRTPPLRGAARLGPQPGALRGPVPAAHGRAPTGSHPRPAAAEPLGPTVVDLHAGRRRRAGMSEAIDPVLGRVLDGLKRLQLLHLRETLPAALSEAAKAEWTYLDFLDQVLRRELEAKQGKRI